MPKKMNFDAHRALQVALAAGFFCAGWVPAAFSMPSSDVAVSQADVQARQAWRENMRQMAAAPGEGCFHASYPSIRWEQVECKAAPVRFQPPPRKITKNQEETVGDGDDYVAKSAGSITETVGSFPSVSGVTSEKSVGVKAYEYEGILGPNEYTLQINSNFDQPTAACKGHSGCNVWQQYVYSPDYTKQGEANLLIQYWLVGYGSRCPSGWQGDGAGDCMKNSATVVAPDEPISELANLKLTGKAQLGGMDTAVFSDGDDVYTLNAKDSVLDIASVWDESEFNIVGDAGGSRAQFNSGSSVAVRTAITDGSTDAPTCVGHAGTTGETNNLSLGTCKVSGGATPFIQFTESN